MSNTLNPHTHPADTSGPQDLNTKGNARSGTNERDMAGRGKDHAPGDSAQYGSKNKPEGENYSDDDMRGNSPQL